MYVVCCCCKNVVDEFTVLSFKPPKDYIYEKSCCYLKAICFNCEEKEKRKNEVN